MKKNIPLDLIKALVTFNQENNISRSAKILGIEQSTLSRQLMSIEDMFDIPLFQKDGREKKLTLFGQSLCGKLTPLINDIQLQLNLAQDEFSNEDTINLKIGGRPEFMKQFLNENQFTGQWEVQNLSSAQVVKALKLKKIDLGLTHLIFDSLDYNSTVLFTDYPAIIIPKKFITEPVSLKKWAQICTNYPAISYNQDLLFMKEFVHLFDIKNKINFKLLFPDWNYVETACADQKGWTILPDRFIANEKKYHVIQLPREEKYSFKMRLYYRKEFAKMKWFQEKISRR